VRKSVELRWFGKKNAYRSTKKGRALSSLCRKMADYLGETGGFTKERPRNRLAGDSTHGFYKQWLRKEDGTLGEAERADVTNCYHQKEGRNREEGTLVEEDCIVSQERRKKERFKKGKRAVKLGEEV